MTQENKRWKLNCGDLGTFDISDNQMQSIKKADSAGARFVDIGEAVVNTAFIKGAVSYTARKSLPVPKHRELTDEEREANIEKMKLLRGRVLDVRKPFKI